MTTADHAESEAGRRFLFVTLPSGPFGSYLDRALRERGATARRVVMNGGEWFDWIGGDTAWFKGPRDGFGPWVERLIRKDGVTDVVVFNDVNPYSQDTLQAARAFGARTWILENGYQRPDWITLESEGVNARSGLPREASAYDDADNLVPPEDGQHIGAITPFHVFNIIQHYTLIVLFSPWLKGYRYPFTVSIAGQVFGHFRRFGLWLWTRKARERQAAQVAKLKPFFLACLQREGDSQLVVHSDLKTNAAFLEKVIGSFARHAPDNAHLMIKNHPLDPGLTDLERAAFRIGAREGVLNRLHFLEGGAFAALSRASEGVIAVNSTAALAAIGFGTPVKLMGRAFFDLPGLVDPQPLETFWTGPRKPDPDLFHRFRRKMSVDTQVWGSFHAPRAMAGTARRLVARMLA